MAGCIRGSKPNWQGQCQVCWPGLCDNSTSIDCRDHKDSGSPTSEAAAEAAAPATAPQARSSSEGGQAAEQDSLVEAGTVSRDAGEGLTEPSVAGSSHSRDARLPTIKTGPEACAQEGGGAAAAAARGNAAADSSTAADEGHGNAAEASGNDAAAPKDMGSASGSGSKPATPRQERSASRRRASGSLEAVSAQSGGEALAIQGLEAPGAASPDADMAGLGAGKSTESRQQPGWSTAEDPQPEQADSEAAEGGTLEEDEPQ